MTAATARTAPPGLNITPQQRSAAIIGVLLGLLLSSLDQTIVSTAGPAIQRDLKISASLYPWLGTSYLILSTVMVPIYGKLADLLGRKAILMTGIAIFLAGSFLCGISANVWQGIIFRAVQGLGAAALFTGALTVIADLYPPAERGKIQGLTGAVFGLSSVVGPLIGGFITDNLSWHWAFFVNLPIGLIALTLIGLRMPALKPQARPKGVDVAGTVWLLVGAVPFLLALSLGRSTVNPGDTGYLWTSWQVLGLFAIAIVGTIGFIITEARASEPILDLRLFSNRVFTLGSAAMFTLGASLMAAVMFLPLYMVNVVGLSATRSGATITPLMLGMVFGSVLAGAIASKTGRYKALMLGGIAVLAGGFAIMGLTLSTGSTQTEVTLKMILVGLGLGPTLPLFALAIQNAVGKELTAVATSAATFFRGLGGVVGIAIFGAVFANSLSAGIKDGVTTATSSLPPAIKAQIAQGAAGQGGEGASLSFDADLIKSRVRNQFEQEKLMLRKALRDHDAASVRAITSNPNTPAPLKAAIAAGASERVLAPAVAAVDQTEGQVLGAVDRMAASFKQAFTTSTSLVYMIGLIVVILGLGLTAAIPEIPLKRGESTAPMAAD